MGIKRARKEIARDVKAGEANKFFLSRKASLSSSLEAHDLFPFLTKTWMECVDRKTNKMLKDKQINKQTDKQDDQRQTNKHTGRQTRWSKNKQKANKQSSGQHINHT